MPRLIDADALADKFVNFETENGIHCDIDRYAIKTIHNAPTVDAVPVRHGKWIPCMMESRGFTNMFKCSECKRYSYYAYPVKCRNYKYCSYCGARMDEDNG